MQTDSAYDRMRGDILTLRLSPGERLSERGLEESAGASRTPVRAALARLSAEGLVRREGRAWTVTPLDLDEVTHAVAYREVLEAAAIDVAVGAASDGELDRLAEFAAVESHGPDELVHDGERFHLELVALAGNPLITDGVRASLIRLARARWLEASRPDRQERSRHEHRAIVVALQARDAATATRLAREHGRRVRDDLLDSLAGDRARGLRVTGSVSRRVG